MRTLERHRLDDCSRFRDGSRAGGCGLTACSCGLASCRCHMSSSPVIGAGRLSWWLATIQCIRFIMLESAIQQLVHGNRNSSHDSASGSATGRDDSLS